MKTLYQALVWIAGGALLLAMAMDTLAMLGRQFGVPFLGAIELVQATVLVASSGALLVAAFEGSHARVHLLLDRWPEYVRALVERLHAAAAVLLYTALLAGSAWIAAGLWHGHEESELVRVPYRPLRVIVVITLTLLLLHSLRRMWRGAAR